MSCDPMADDPTSGEPGAQPAAPRNAVEVRNLRKKYRLFDTPGDRLREAFHPWRRKFHRDFWALDGVSFDIPAGRTLGVLGRNGSGKSTLLQVICGILRPTEGEVRVNGRIAALLELGAGFNPEFTGRDNVMLNGAVMGVEKAEMLARMPEIEAFADIGDFFDQPVKTYSSGMYVRVAFAAAINVDPAILVVDEALAVGDVRFQEKCYRKFKEFQDAGKTILLVTHATHLVEQFCSDAVLLDGGKLLHHGPPQETVDVYEELLFPRRRHAGPVSAGPISAGETVRLHEVDVQPAAVRQKEATDSDRPEALRRFLTERHDEDRCPLRRSYNNQEIRFGDAGARIVDYLIVVGDEADPVNIASGAWVDVYLKVKGDAGVRRPDIGLGVFTATGLMVCSGSTILSSMRIPAIAPGDTQVYRIGFKCLMTAGHYFLHFALTEPSSEGEIRHDARRSVCCFQVPPQSHQEGLCDLGMTVSETPMEG